MIYPVKKVFIDKYTKKKYKVGETYEIEDKKRGNELKKLGFLGTGKNVLSQEKYVQDGDAE